MSVYGEWLNNTMQVFIHLLALTSLLIRIIIMYYYVAVELVVKDFVKESINLTDFCREEIIVSIVHVRE